MQYFIIFAGIITHCEEEVSAAKASLEEFNTSQQQLEQEKALLTTAKQELKDLK